jgi:hypothetical protein
VYSAPGRAPPAVSGREFASFRDPSGHVFRGDGEVYRWVHSSYALQFRLARESGLLDKAVAAGLLIPFEDCGSATHPSGFDQRNCFTVLKPRQLETITYPYEWSFGQLQDAAQATLDLHLLALDHGMLLKDANAFNIQFVDGRPALIDHLSFDALAEHRAWPAYGQFCRHFLAPLLLMSYVDLSLSRLLQVHLDGIPLDLASSLLPLRTRFNPGIQIHLHAHARMSQKYADTRSGRARKTVAVGNISVRGLRAIASSLLSLVRKLKPKEQKTEWGEYYSDTNYSSDAFEEKKSILRDLVQRAAPRTVWDVGGNNGEFSRAIQDLAGSILCMDLDPRAVDQNYALCKQGGITNILPLVFDLTNPSPGLGFANRERPALFARGHPDLIVTLALIHHLSISNNLPFSYLARLFAGLAPALIIEFVPKSDSQVQRLLASRKDIFPNYDQGEFAAEFSAFFDIVDTRAVPGTDRTLFLMMRNEALCRTA